MCNINCLKPFSLGEPVLTVSSDFCSWLTGVEFDVVSCCSNQSVTKSDMLCILRYYSAHHCSKE